MPANKQQKSYKSWKERRFYETGAYQDPHSWFYMDHPTLSDWYNLSTLLDFMDSAEKAGVNPLYYVALGISETNLGNKSYTNPSRIFYKSHPDLSRILAKIPDSQEEKIRKAHLDYGAKYLASKFKEFPNDVISALQAYSGKGRTIYGGRPDMVEYITGSKRSFGKPYHKINYWRDKPQALRILEIASILQNTPELEGLFEPTVSKFLGRY